MHFPALFLFMNSCYRKKLGPFGVKGKTYCLLGNPPPRGEIWWLSENLPPHYQTLQVRIYYYNRNNCLCEKKVRSEVCNSEVCRLFFLDWDTLLFFPFFFFLLCPAEYPPPRYNSKNVREMYKSCHLRKGKTACLPVFSTSSLLTELQTYLEILPWSLTGSLLSLLSPH